MLASLQDAAMAAADLAMAALPRPKPSVDALRRCKLVSHRGEHDNIIVRENTLTAFDNARRAGVWGIECDIRFTADGVPVICHDPDTVRVFGIERVVAECTADELRRQVPELPTLAEVLAACAAHTHLMLEVKTFDPALLPAQRAALREQLAPLTPGVDFHILALDPALFTLVDFLPPSALLPVAELNLSQLSALALAEGYCGVAGHYLLAGAGILRRHRAAGQRVATGFPASRNCLYRELNRGIEWVFSNDAVKLQACLDAALAGQ